MQAKMCNICGRTYNVKVSPVLLKVRQGTEVIDVWTTVSTCGYCDAALAAS